jgi:hypothetical protein
MRRPLLLALPFLAGCATAAANYGPSAAEHMTQNRHLDVLAAWVYPAAAQLAAEMGWTIHESDSATGIISASTPETMGRRSDDVSVFVTSEGAGSRVTVRSGLANGPNVEHIGAYLATLTERVAAMD